MQYKSGALPNEPRKLVDVLETYTCEKCGVYMGASGDPITGASSPTLCYDCAEEEDEWREGD